MFYYTRFVCMKPTLLVVVLFLSECIFAQIDIDSIKSKYLEDQIYIGLQYNVLNEKPSGVSQNGFSGGISFGFIKDIPFNDQRNIGVGIGIGYQYNAIIQNLKISEVNGNVTFELGDDFQSNNFKVHSIEIPLEFRWRNSTSTKYKFWRVYSGFKLNYNFKVTSEYKDDLVSLKTLNIDEFERLNYGVYIASGYSTWNLYVYYGLNPLFKSGLLNSEKIRMKEINIGLRFYIL